MIEPKETKAERRTAKVFGPDPIDVHVGGKLRQARELAGLTQMEIAERIGLSFQAVQKYESGANRISASRLVQFAMLVSKSPASFFEGLGWPGDEATSTDMSRDEIQLVRGYRSIGNSDLRRVLVQLATLLGESP